MNLRHLIHPPVDWLDEPSGKRVCGVALAACVGLALYGFSVGYWRSPTMGLYVAVKMPLLVALTLGFNGLLNGLLGILLGTGLGFRQSLLALLSSFALAALILGSLAPVTWLMAWNAPSPASPHAGLAHSCYLIFHTFLIGMAGVAANLHLHSQLSIKAPSRKAAAATLVCWLAGNGFLGAQFSWLLRPFFGSPGLKVEFLRPDPMESDFYTAVWRALERITHGNAIVALICFALVLALLLYRTLKPRSLQQTSK